MRHFGNKMMKFFVCGGCKHIHLWVNVRKENVKEMMKKGVLKRIIPFVQGGSTGLVCQTVFAFHQLEGELYFVTDAPVKKRSDQCI